MNIKPYDKTIRDILGSKRQFVIPRFQKEYSWDKKNYQELFEDMIGNLVLDRGKILYSQYFLGIMLFIGNFTEGTDQEIQVVDGQILIGTSNIFLTDDTCFIFWSILHLRHKSRSTHCKSACRACLQGTGQHG